MSRQCSARLTASRWKYWASGGRPGSRPSRSSTRKASECAAKRTVSPLARTEQLPFEQGSAMQSKNTAKTNRRPGLLDRLEKGAVICAEGYLFEFERRGYLQAGAYVPEVVLEHPDLVAELHREFVHAGSDVVEAFTYYAHREKLRIIGKEHLLEQMNRQALEIAKGVARETGALFAGDICNTNVFVGNDESRRAVRAMFEEQVGWAAEAGVDYVIAETYSWAEEALIALEAIKAAGLPAVVTLAIHQEPDTREG